MKLFKMIVMGISSGIFLAACSQHSNSKIDGHYEESSQEKMAGFENKQVVPPEYEKSQGVIVSLPALKEFNKEAMVADFLSSGIEKVWIATPSSFRGTLQNAEFKRLRALAGQNITKISLVSQKVSGPVSVWARDWSPLSAKAADADGLHLLDFNYYPERQSDDSAGRSLLNLLPLERVSVPVYNEGGNFMTNRNGHCMMTTRVTDANEEAYFAEDMVLDAEQIKDYYKNFAGCKTVEIFPRIPYEGTGHIDMWAKFLNDDTIIVNELRPEILALTNYTVDALAKVKNLQRYLDLRARDIANLGFKVIRTPMPAPIFNDNFGDVFRSYTNSLTMNGKVWIPRYTSPAFSQHAVQGKYPDAALIDRYETEIVRVYSDLGYEVHWVASDDIIPYGGAIHCITMQVAE